MELLAQNLLSQMSDTFIIMEKSRVPDGESGFITTWREGPEIDLSVRHDQTLQALRAMAEGVTSVYTFLAPKNCGLDYHDVVKRKSDGQCFRITSQAGETVTPEMSSLQLTVVTAERWELPSS